jgi:hypothetical protein
MNAINRYCLCLTGLLILATVANAGDAGLRIVTVKDGNWKIKVTKDFKKDGSKIRIYPAGEPGGTNDTIISKAVNNPTLPLNTPLLVQLQNWNKEVSDSKTPPAIEFSVSMAGKKDYALIKGVVGLVEQPGGGKLYQITKWEFISYYAVTNGSQEPKEFNKPNWKKAFVTENAAKGSLIIDHPLSLMMEQD